MSTLREKVKHELDELTPVTLFFCAGWLLIHYAEQAIYFWRATGNFAEANRWLFSEIVWPHLWGVQPWMLVLPLPFCAFRELVRSVGRDRKLALLFCAPSSAPSNRIHQSETKTS